MNRKQIAILGALGSALLAVPAIADEVVRSFRQQIPVADARKVHLDFPVGELTVEPGDVAQVGLDVKVKCKDRSDRCLEAARSLKVTFDNGGDVFHLRVKDFPKWRGGANGLHVDARITVPREMPLHAELGVGEMNVAGLAGDLDVDLGVGEVNVTLPKEAVASVDLDTGVGEANLVAAGHRYESAGLVARELHWDRGTGRSKVTVDCGVGEIGVVVR